MVGRRKNNNDAWMPQRVYRGKSCYEYRPRGGKTIRLCKFAEVVDDKHKAEVWAAYKQLTGGHGCDVNALIDAYESSPQFAQLSPRSQTDQRDYSKRIRRVFGAMLPSEVKTHHIRAFMDKLGAQVGPSGKPKTVTANRHHSYLSVLFGFAVSYNWCSANPARDIRKFREKPRDRYIEDWEYALVLGIARASGSPWMAPMMEISYLCRARSVEIRALTENDILEAGIYIRRTKNSESEVTEWSPRLRAAVDDARAIFRSAPVSVQRPLFHGKRGEPVPAETIKTAWQKIMKKALSSGLKERFTFHDIKPKGVTDHETKASGHKSKKMAEVYNRKPDIVKSTR